LRDNGCFRARTLSQDFSQVSGKEFNEIHAPVINDAIFHLVLELKILLNLEANVAKGVQASESLLLTQITQLDSASSVHSV
jgi:hypothetical protein